MARCYKEDIPDEIPPLLHKSGRAPSYKSIATAILKNDHNLVSLGFSPKASKNADYLRCSVKSRQSMQKDLFF